MDAILQAMDLKKRFKLSAKQQKLENSRRKFVDAVGGLSFSVNRGEIYGLLGPNGAGKTTTLRMLATLIRPDAGDALLEGRSIVKEPEEVAAHRLFDQRTEAGGLLFALVPVRFFRPAARAFPAGARRAQGGTVRYIWHWRIRRREGGEPFHRHEAKGRPGHFAGARPGHRDLR